MNQRGLLIVYFFLLLGLTESFSQNERQVDSLKRVLVNSEGQARMEPILALFDLVHRQDLQEGIALAKEYKQLASRFQLKREQVKAKELEARLYQIQFKLDSLKLLATAGVTEAKRLKMDTSLGVFYNFLGIYHEKSGSLDSAIYYYEMSLSTSFVKKMHLYNNLGLAYNRKGNYLKSLEYLEFAMIEAQKLGETNAEAVISNNISMAHGFIGNPDKAEEYAWRSIELKGKIGDERGKLFALTQLLKLDKSLEEKKEYATMGLGIANEVGDEVFSRFFSARMAKILSEEGRHEEALEMVLPAYETARQQNSYDFHEVLVTISETYLALQQHSNARYYAEELLQRAEKNQAFDQLQSARNILLKVYDATGEYKKFNAIAKVYYPAQDSLQQKANIDKWAYLDSKLKNIEQEREIELLNNELAQKEIRRFWMIAVAALAGLILLLVIYFRDRRIKAQKDLIERERETAKKLEQINEKLQGLDEMKSQFFTNITHEFRTPLTVILGTAEQLQANAQAKGATTKKLSLIKQNGENLLELVNQMLDLAKAEANQLKAEYLQGDLIQYLRYITESFRSLAAEKGIKLSIDATLPELIMDYDTEKIRQTLTNLISNALKYTPRGGKVQVKVDTKEQAYKQMLSLTVEDNGKGIPQKDLDNIFDRFFQVDDNISRTGGSGIGLALTKELVKIMGGYIAVNSAVNKGTAFTIHLPITNTAPMGTDIVTDSPGDELHQTPVEEQKGAKKMGNAPSILVIEDSADVADYLKDCLDETYNVQLATDGQMGIDLAFKVMPDLVISDVMMPYKNGFEVCDALKSNQETSHIPIILLTAKADLESRLSGLEKGADAYLTKPFNRQELLVQVQSLLKSRLRQLEARNMELERLVEEKKEQILRAQDQLILQEKLAFLGQLTAGIAHEIKNPLNFVNNFAEGSVELIDELSEEMQQIEQVIDADAFANIMEILVDLKENAKDIYKNGCRADRIVGNMMDHARNPEGERHLINLNQLVDDSLNLAYHGYRAIEPGFNVHYQKRYDESIPLLSGYAHDLSRVMLNLLNNACYAVHEKQRSVGNGYRPVIAVETRQENEKAIISIRDNGMGLTPEVQENVFTPFFTTKSTGHGSSGLGLSISYDIVVHQHEGEITIESEPGKFATFSVSLPIQ